MAMSSLLRSGSKLLRSGSKLTGDKDKQKSAEKTLLEPSAAKKSELDASDVSHATLDCYKNPEGLRDVFESGAIRLLRGSYLVKMHERGEKIQRRQDMPEEAFWTAREIMDILTDRTEYPAIGFPVTNGASNPGKRAMYFILALSYRWTEPEHPDRSGHHLGAVAQFVEKFTKWVQRGVKLQDVAVFWDFPCLYQKTRTDEQERLFKKGLSSANLIYGHSHTWCLMQKSQPDAGRDLVYERSGWCTFESIVGAMNKNSTWYWDISAAAERRFPSFSAMMEVCKQTTKRPVPLTPERMQALLERARFTNGKTDPGLVLGMYKDISKSILAQSEGIDLNNQVYSELDVELMAEVLPMCTGCKRVCMWGIDLGEHGAHALAPAFKQLPSVQEIFLEASAFGGNTHRLLPQVIPPNLPILKLSNYGGNGTNGRRGTLGSSQCMELAKALAEWIQKPGSPKSLNLELMPSGEFRSILKTAWRQAGRNERDLKF